MNELFQIDPVKSPRLRWMERHHLTLDRAERDGAIVHIVKHGMMPIGTGQTGDDALVAAAKSLNIKLWNEANA